MARRRKQVGASFADAREIVKSRQAGEKITSIDQAREKMGNRRKAPELKDGMARVIERVFDRAEKLWPEYDRLEDELSLKDGSTGGEVGSALSNVEGNASDAHLLMIAAKFEFERFDAEQEAYLAPMRQQVRADLERKKAAKDITKNITDKDITDKLAEQFPDELTANRDRKSRAEQTVDHLERLATLWRQRSYSLAPLMNR